jgi:hypothetical protein
MEIKEKKKGDPLWITVGFVFALLGGAVGLGFGANYAWGNYDKRTKTIGWIMFVIAFFVTLVARDALMRS